MASYKNSAGNVGISNEYYNWRYFNSSLQRLGEYRAPTLSGGMSPVMTEAAIDYMDVANRVFQGYLGWFQARKELGDKIGDRLWDELGPEGYKKALAESNVPMQDNPFAMARLKYRYGRSLSTLAQEDFNTRINRGEFVGKEPEEVELAFMNSKRQILEEMSPEDYPIDLKGDYSFQNGFWQDTRIQREKNFVASTDVSNDWFKQDATRQLKGTIGGLVEAGASPDEVFSLIPNFEMTYGMYYDPKEKASFYEDIITNFATVPHGSSYIDYIKDKKVPDTDYTFEDYLGKDFFTDIKVKADNYRFRALGQSFYEFKSQVDNDARSGSVAKLRAQLKDELRNNDNLVTDRTEYLYRAIDEAIAAQKKIASASNGGAKWGNVTDDAYRYYRDVALGVPSVTEEEKIKQWEGSGFGANDRKVVQQRVVSEILVSGSTEEKTKLFKSVTATGVPSELRTYTSGILSNLFSGAIDDPVRTYIQEGKLPQATTDGSTVEITDRTGKSIGYVPTELKAFMDMVSTNKSAIETIIGSSKNKEFLNRVDTISMAQRLGKNPIEVLALGEKFKQEREEEARRHGVPISSLTYSIDIEDINNIDENLVRDAKLNQELTNIALYKAMQYRLKDGSATFNDVWDAAAEETIDSFYGIGNMAIPKSILLSEFKDIDYDSSVANSVLSMSSKSFYNILEANGIDTKDPNNYLLSNYNYTSDNIDVIGADGVYHFSIPMKDFVRRIYTDYQKKNNKG